MKNQSLWTVVLVVFFSLCSLQAAVAGGGYKVGDHARDFSLKSVDGSMVSFESYPDAKGFIVVFTCNHCPYAVAYEDRIIDLHKKFALKGYPVIAINPNDTNAVPDDSYANMITRSQKKGFPFAYLIDPTQDIATAYGATRTPHVFLVQKQNGAFVVRYIGAIDDNAEDAIAAKHHYVEDAIAALESGAEPNPTMVKAVGCTIKWAKK